MVVNQRMTELNPVQNSKIEVYKPIVDDISDEETTKGHDVRFVWFIFCVNCVLLLVH